MTKRLAIFGSGRGSNAEAIYQSILEDTIPAEIVVLVCDQPQARLVQLGQTWKIPVHVVRREDYSSLDEFDTALLEVLRPYAVDGILLAGFMRILGPTFVNAYVHRILNIHPSILPQFRGLRAQQQALEAGVSEAGCTAHFVDTGVDTGPIIQQAKVPVYPDDTVETLSERILEEEHRIYPDVVRLFCEDALRVDGQTVRIVTAQTDTEGR
jgi:phosphoribosylglycinamide formyltransferase